MNMDLVKMAKDMLIMHGDRGRLVTEDDFKACIKDTAPRLAQELLFRHDFDSLNAGVCPDCSSRRFSKHTMEGAQTEVTCKNCNARFAIALPFIVERIEL